MALAVRIIPTLLCRGGSLVKGRRFAADRVIGHVQQAMRIHQQRGVDELILLDIDATPKGIGPNFQLIEELSQQCFMPLTVGGGVRSIEDIQGLLRIGADKIAIRTGAIHNPSLIYDAAHRFGSQAIVVAVDVQSDHQVAELRTEPVRWSKNIEELGAGEIILTSIDHEGMMEGYDLDLIHSVSEAVSIPVIAHGGCGTPQHALEAIQAGASAVAIGSIFAFTDETPKSVARYLADHGVEVRQ